MMILKVDNVGVDHELTMLMLTVDDNVGVPVMVKQANVSAQEEGGSL